MEDTTLPERSINLSNEEEKPRLTKGLGVVVNNTPEAAKASLERLNAVFPCMGDEPSFADVHFARFNCYLSGIKMADLAEVDNLTIEGVRRSIFYCQQRMPIAERLQSHAVHIANRTALEHSDKYLSVLDSMMKEKSWMARGAALKAFRRTVGMEGASVINVAIDNRKQTINANGGGSGSSRSTFEGAMDRVRQSYRELPPKPENQALAGDAIDAEIVDG